MILLFNPQLENDCRYSLEDNNMILVSTSGLLQVLAFISEFKTKLPSAPERIINCMECIQECDFPKPSFKESFLANKLAYTVDILKRIDTPLFNKNDRYPDLDDYVIPYLKNIELKMGSMGMADYSQKLLSHLRNEKNWITTDLKIRITESPDMLSGVLKEIFKELNKRGIEISEINHSQSKQDTIEPHSDRSVDLLLLGILIQDEPDNLNHIINYLTFPIHPLDDSFRYGLANRLLEDDLVYDEDVKITQSQNWKDEIDTYVSTHEKELKCDSIFYTIFSERTGEINDNLVRYASALKSWAQSSHSIQEQTVDWNYFAEFCDNVERILTLPGYTFSFPELYFWIKFLKSQHDYAYFSYMAPPQKSIHYQKQMTSSKKTSNTWGKKKEYKINKNLISNLDTEEKSFSKLDKLIQTPFEYILKYELDLESYFIPSSRLSNNKIGITAHNVLKKVFDDPNNKCNNIIQSGKPDALLADYENKLDSALGTKNIHVKKTKNTLRKSFENLLNILIKNQFKIIEADEVHHLNNDTFDKVSIKPDLFLQNNKGYFIIDYKWTTRVKYDKIIEDSKDIQQTLYMNWWNLSGNKKCKIESYGYFDLKKGELYVPSEFKSFFANTEGITFVDRADAQKKSDVIYEEIISSVKFRKEQLNNGIIEEAENMETSGLAYCKNEKTKNLFPLNTKQKTKGTYKEYAIMKPNRILKDDLQ